MNLKWAILIRLYKNINSDLPNLECACIDSVCDHDGVFNSCKIAFLLTIELHGHFDCELYDLVEILNYDRLEFAIAGLLLKCKSHRQLHKQQRHIILLCLAQLGVHQ